jgi:ABC-type nitrate/sulfonate/bicarbonate transport system substrate-binding protein
LRRLGLDPERDGVQIIVTGDELTTAAAMLEGAIDGAAISYTAATELKARGYHSWDLAPLGIPEVTGIVARPGLLRERPEESRRLLRSLAAANTYIRTIGSDEEARQRVAEVVGNRLRTAPDRVLLQLDLVKDHLPADLRLHMDEARELQSLTALVSPEVRDMRVEDWLDQSYLDQLQQEEFFETLGRQ